MEQIVDKLNKIAKKIDENVEIPDSDLIIDSLDAITTALGGTPNDSKLIVDKLDNIAKVATGGGGGGGMQLYGPYVATNSTAVTVQAGQGQPIDLDAVFTYDGVDVIYPESDAIIVVRSSNAGTGVDLVGFFPPSYYQGEWSNGFTNVVNHWQNDQTVDVHSATVIFYSSVEFTLK